jgi:hypothetical protein
VAGAIALLLSNTHIKEVAAEERAFLIQDLLTGSVEECGEAGQNHRFGFGRIDVLKAIGFARELGYGVSNARRADSEASGRSGARPGPRPSQAR